MTSWGNSLRYQFALLVWLASLSGCQYNSSGSSQQFAAIPYYSPKSEDGFSLLWEPNEKRCKKQQEGETVYFKNCRAFEMQTPLYNYKARPRPIHVQLKFLCEAQGRLAFKIAVAKKPVAVASDQDKTLITNAWRQEEFSPQAQTQVLSMEIPAYEKAMFVAIMDPFTAQTVKAGCRLSYRFDLAP